MAYKSGLGRGLGALIPGDEESMLEKGISFVPVASISPNPRQPRTVKRPEELHELTDLIRTHGVLQPLIVTRGTSPGQYILIAGERRWSAARLAGLTEVPVLVREASDEERLELAIIENVQRADLSALEEAEAYRQLAEDFNLSHEAIAAKVGRSRVSITNTLRLLKLDDSVKNALVEGRITPGHARALLALATPEAQSAVLNTVLSHDLNVRKTEELVRKLSGEKVPASRRAAVSPEINFLEESLRSSLGTRVNLRATSRGGTITIHYFSQEELDALLARLLKPR